MPSGVVAVGLFRAVTTHARVYTSKVKDFRRVNGLLSRGQSVTTSLADGDSLVNPVAHSKLYFRLSFLSNTL